MIRLGWPSFKADSKKKENGELLNKVESLITALTTESKEQTEERLKKQQYENYIPPEDRRPLDEFFDLDAMKADECIGEPIDIKYDGE